MLGGGGRAGKCGLSHIGGMSWGRSILFFCLFFKAFSPSVGIKKITQQ